MVKQSQQGRDENYMQIIAQKDAEIHRLKGELGKLQSLRRQNGEEC